MKKKNALKNHFFLFNVVTKQQHWGRFWVNNCHLLYTTYLLDLFFDRFCLQNDASVF